MGSCLAIRCRDCMKFIGKQQLSPQDIDEEAIHHHQKLMNVDDSVHHTYTHTHTPPDHDHEQLNQIEMTIVPDTDFIQSTEVLHDPTTEELKRIGQSSFLMLLEMTSMSFEGYEILLDEPTGLKIWGRFYQDLDKCYVSALRYTFTIKATIERYQQYIGDLKQLMKLESSIDAYERVLGDQMCCVQYLRYKKMLMMDPREFLYVKYSKHDRGRYIEVSKSICLPNVQVNNTNKSAVRGLLLLSGNIIEEIEPGVLRFTAYSESNMKLRINPSMTKKVSAIEIKKGKERMEKFLLTQ